MINLKTNIFFKLGIILALILVLMVPTHMVKNLIDDRQEIQSNAINEVSSKWGGVQTITGPFIAIPFDEYSKQLIPNTNSFTTVKTQNWLYFLPETLKVNGDLNPQKRIRGIYEVIVYDTKLNISGIFNHIDLSKFNINETNLHLDLAKLNLGITDLKGIEKQVNLNWNGENIIFNSGISGPDIISSGINSSILIDLDSNANYTFSLDIELKGSQNIYFNPLGKTTDVSLKSNWTTPSFSGNYLPDDREVTESGFEAHWNILNLNRNYPQYWIGNKYSIKKSSFGVDLLLPVDKYKKSDRVVKYAILFLILTYLVFFFVEVLNQVFIHPIQYLLIGIAILLFYTLLLSFSEHIDFNSSYILSSLMTISLITAYMIAVIKSKTLSLMIGSILGIFYTFIFIIIQLEDFALLIGSLGIFFILCVVMYFSRKIDWYDIKIGMKPNKFKE